MAASGRAILLARDVEGSEGVGKYSQPCIIVCIMCTQASCSYIAVLHCTVLYCSDVLVPSHAIIIINVHFLQVKCCPVCQRMNKKLTLERPELHPVPVKSPWHHLGMDFVGPISPPSQSGNRYILTLSDYFTKFAWAKAMPTKEAMNVVSALREVSTVILCHHFIPIIIYVAISNFLFLFASIFQLFFIMGLPSVMTTDQGREFHNRL